MDKQPQFPDALQVARAMVQVLRTKLTEFDAVEIALTREKAALCLGLAEGVAEHFERGEVHTA